MHGALFALLAFVTFHGVTEIAFAQGDFFYTSFFQSPRYAVVKYFFHREMKLTWYAANNFCLGRGKNLAVIENSSEDLQIAALVKTGEMFWIDGTDKDDEGNFVWSSTGEPISYWNWIGLNLNDRNHTENCLAMNRYGNAKLSSWNDVRCSSMHFFICEKRQ